MTQLISKNIAYTLLVPTHILNQYMYSQHICLSSWLEQSTVCVKHSAGIFWWTTDTAGRATGSTRVGIKLARDGFSRGFSITAGLGSGSDPPSPAVSVTVLCLMPEPNGLTGTTEETQPGCSGSSCCCCSGCCCCCCCCCGWSRCCFTGLFSFCCLGSFCGCSLCCCGCDCCCLLC